MNKINKINPPRFSSLIIIVSKNLRNLRQQANLSQEELADRCGYHRTYISSIERGERNITLSTLEALSTALKVGVKDMLANLEEEKGKNDH